MAIRLPLQIVLDRAITAQQDGHAASVNGGVADAFLIPQDADNIVVKYVASIGGGGASAILQTSDDGGTTWYDVARTSIISAAAATDGRAEWLSVPVMGVGVRTTVIATSNIANSILSQGSIYGGIGSSPASALAQRAVSGIPILGRQARVFRVYQAGCSVVVSERIQVLVNSQSATP